MLRRNDRNKLPSGQHYVMVSSDSKSARNRPCVLFLHGGGVSGAQSIYGRATFLVRRLARKYRVIIPNWGGIADSEGMKVSYSVAAIAASIVRILQAERVTKVYLIGYSWGAILALHIAAFYPKYVKRLVLICPTAEQVSRKYRCIGLTLLAMLVMRPFMTYVIGWASCLDTESRVRHGHLRFQREFAKAKLRHAIGTVVALWGFDSRPWLKNIRCPTLLISGRHDVHCDAIQRNYLVSGIQYIRSILIGNSHIPLDTNIRKVTEAITGFLEEQE